MKLNDCIEAISNDLLLTDPISKIMNNSCTIVDSEFSMERLTDIPIYVISKEELLKGEINKTELLLYYQSVKEELKDKRELVKWFELSFNTAYEGVAVVDSNGVIKLFNDMYSRFVGCQQRMPLDSDNTRLPKIARSV